MLDLVPLAGTGWEMRDADANSRHVSKVLELELPQPTSRAVAATAVGGDHQSRGVGVRLAAHRLPPLSDAAHRKLSRVVIDAHGDPAFVATDVVDAVWDRFAELRIDKVVYLHAFRLAFWVPLAPTVLEVANQFLLLRVD